MGVLGVIINDPCTCCCYLLSIVVDFRILLIDRVSRSGTRIVVVDRVSRSDTG